MLAMPNAAGHRQLGDLLAMRVGAAGVCTAVPAVRPAGPIKHAALRALPAKTAAVAAAGDGE
ncbi:hypothetical protein NUBL21980_24010 [Klebsiella michiganensis]|nr:hypothetical protein NUBL21980_24010 [Klebsiella michiganensis]